MLDIKKASSGRKFAADGAASDGDAPPAQAPYFRPFFSSATALCFDEGEIARHKRGRHNCR
jgi:hypothetical protein